MNVTSTLYLPHHRNPILGEKSPRNSKVFDYAIPTKAETNYIPSVSSRLLTKDAYPLIAKFESQQKSFWSDIARRQKFIQELTISNEKKNEKMMAIIGGIQHSNLQYATNKDFQSEHFLPKLNENVNLIESTCALTHAQKIPKPNANTLRHLSTTHPDVCAQIRAQRAAEFVESKIISTTSTSLPSSPINLKYHQTALASTLKELEKTNKLIQTYNNSTQISEKDYRSNITRPVIHDAIGLSLKSSAVLKGAADERQSYRRYIRGPHQSTIKCHL